MAWTEVVWSALMKIMSCGKDVLNFPIIIKTSIFMNKRIYELISELRAELNHDNCKLALYGDRLVLVKTNNWDDTYLKVDIKLQENALFDYPVY
jgi:hypothetical protein